MKQNARAMILSLILAGSLTTPALAGVDADAQALAEKCPQEYAAFDAEAWLSGGEEDLTVARYMAAKGQKTYEQFRRSLFRQWAGREEGFYEGYCVMIDGVPVPFRLYRDEAGKIAAPKAENGRILIPLRAAAEAMGLTVEWREETGEVVCSNEQQTVTFTLGSTAYSGGALDVAPWAEKGVT